MGFGGVLTFGERFSLIGHGTLDGNVIMEGKTYPGYTRPTPTFLNRNNRNPIGTLTIGGDFRQRPGGVLNIEVKSPRNHDLLVVGGIAKLSGTLRIRALGYRPKVGDRIPILKAGRIVGQFTKVQAPLPGLYTVEFVKEGGLGVLVVGSSSPSRYSPLSPRLRMRSN